MSQIPLPASALAKTMTPIGALAELARDFDTVVVPDDRRHHMRPG
ncbi:hypothetical protein [Bradyrhizobium sp. BTAi1]|nr:hypothetical protein [Bradyrhizobium sp. BTAi1]